MSVFTEKDFDALSSLGLFIFASSIAGLISSYIWGKLADRSSKKVLLISALTSAVGFALLLVMINAQPEWLHAIYTLPIMLFVLMVAYQGVRLGRATHLVDMATTETRADYTAVSNTIIGLLLLLGSAFGWIAEILGLAWVFGLFLAMSLLAAVSALQLNEVQS